MDRELLTLPEHMYLLRFLWSPCWVSSVVLVHVDCLSFSFFIFWLSVCLSTLITSWYIMPLIYFIYYELANISKYIFYQTIIIMKISLKLQQVLLMLIKINSFLKFSFYVQRRCYSSKLDIEKVSRWDENSVILKQHLFVATLVILSRCCTNLLDVGVSYSLAIQHPEGLIDD